jgi:hypothetical protein
MNYTFVELSMLVGCTQLNEQWKTSTGMFETCQPKGSMAKGYIFDEALGLCTKYMQNLGAM